MSKKVIILLVLLSFILMTGTALAKQKTLPVPQVWQHKDTNMLCALPHIAGLPNNAAHPWNCATLNLDVHCMMYCAPAACSMYGLYWNRTSPYTDQDNIYDNGKISGGEITGNGIIETHGLGMYAGTGGTPPEIQGSFTYAVGIAPFQFGPSGSANPLLTCGSAEWFIDYNIPILWIDMGNWPGDMPVDSIPQELRYESGHCRIIAGYNDLMTPEDCSDDSLLIYDPWPTSGSPYWLPVTSVIDQNDIYLTTQQPYATEKKSWGEIKNIFSK